LGVFCLKKLKTLFLGFVLLAMACVSVETAMAATCSKPTLRGSYGAVLSGVSDGIVLDSGGLIVADGEGNLSGSWTANANGTVQTNVPFTGTYNVGATCTGEATLIFSSGTAQLNIVVDSANQWQLIETDSGTTQSGYALSVGTSACSNSSIKGTWSWLQMNAYLVGFGPGAFLGVTKLSGTGSLTGSAITQSIDGEILTGLTAKGTYTVNTDCTGTVTVNVPGQISFPIAIVIVSNGHEILGIGMLPTGVSIQTASPVLN
jgi:hypothetical protein